MPQANIMHMDVARTVPIILVPVASYAIEMQWVSPAVQWSQYIASICLYGFHSNSA